MDWMVILGAGVQGCLEPFTVPSAAVLLLSEQLQSPLDHGLLLPRPLTAIDAVRNLLPSVLSPPCSVRPCQEQQGEEPSLPAAAAVRCWLALPLAVVALLDGCFAA